MKRALLLLLLASTVFATTNQNKVGTIPGAQFPIDYTASGTLLSLSGTVFSVHEGTLTSGKGCSYLTGTGIVCNSDFLTAATLPTIDISSGTNLAVSSPITLTGDTVGCATCAETDKEETIKESWTWDSGLGTVTVTVFPLLQVIGVPSGDNVSMWADAVKWANIAAGFTTSLSQNAVPTDDRALTLPDASGTLWCDGNDGTGSGLDADTVDGSHASAFLTAETDPQVGTLTDTKWCVASATDIDCATDPPVLAEADTLATVTGRGATTATPIVIGPVDDGGTTYTSTHNGNGAYYVTDDGGDIGNLFVLPPATITSATRTLRYPFETGTIATQTYADNHGPAEADPQVGTLTNGKWCTSDGSATNCATDPPVLTEVDPRLPVPANPGDDNKWLRANAGVASWQTITEGDGIVGNEVTNATNATLTRSGTGSAIDPYTLGLNLGNANTWTAAQMIDGSADVEQLVVQGNATQTGSVFIVENSAGTDKFTVSNTGNVNAALTVYGGTGLFKGTGATVADGIQIGYSAVSATFGSMFGWEGATADGNEGELTLPDVTADRTWIGPDESGVLQLNGVCNMTADDATPSMVGCRIWQSVENTGAVVITDLDNPIVGQIYILITGHATNPPSIADGGNFALTAAWAPDSVGDNISIFVASDNVYYEVARSNN